METDEQTYHQVFQSLSAHIHPFELETQQWRIACKLPAALATFKQRIPELDMAKLE